MADDQRQRVLDAMRTELGDPSTWGAPVEMRDSLALCALNSAHSLRAGTPSMRRVLRRYRDHRTAMGADPEKDSGRDLRAVIDAAGGPEGFSDIVIDDHSRFAYVEMHSDERSQTAIGLLRRVVAYFARLGVEVERVLSDNGSAYRSRAWRDACTELGIKPKRTRPYRPQTNGTIERFHRTLADGWAYARFYSSETERRAALPGWLHFYNHHRVHSAIGAAPATRLNNLPGHHS